MCSARTNHWLAARASCSLPFGSGHLRRTISLSSLLRPYFGTAQVFVDDTSLARQICSQLVPDVSLHFVPAEVILPGDFSDIGCLLLDVHPMSLSQELSFDRSIRLVKESGIHITCFNHLVGRRSHADLIFDQYLTNTDGSKCSGFFGADYAVLESDFLACSSTPRVRSTVENILVSLGGTDPFGSAYQILDALNGASFSGTVHVVRGFSPLINLHPPNMSFRILDHGCVNRQGLIKLIQGCDVGITGFGTTLYEMNFLGLPSAMVSHYQCQNRNAYAYADKGATWYLGCCESGLNTTEIRDKLRVLLEEPQIRRELSRIGKLFIDGKGGARVAGEIANRLSDRFRAAQFHSTGQIYNYN